MDIWCSLQPPGRNIGNGAGKLGKEWGQVRGRNGVIIAEPTQHPEGGEYHWTTTGVVAALPDEIADLLPDASDEDTDAATDKQVREFLRKHSAASPSWKASHPNAIHGPLCVELALPPTESRHDEAVSATVWAMEEAAAGCYSAAEASAGLKKVFVESVVRRRRPEDRKLSTRLAKDEWKGILAWAVGKAVDKTPEELDAIRAKVNRNKKTAMTNESRAGQRNSTQTARPPASMSFG